MFLFMVELWGATVTQQSQTPSQRSHFSTREGQAHSDTSSLDRRSSRSSDAGASYLPTEGSSGSSQTGASLQLHSHFYEDPTLIRNLVENHQWKRDPAALAALAEAIEIYTQYDVKNEASSSVIADLEKHSESLDSSPSAIEFIEDEDMVTQFVAKYDIAIRTEQAIRDPFTSHEDLVIQQIAPLTFLQWKGQYYRAFGNRGEAQTAFEVHERIITEIQALLKAFVEDYSFSTVE